MKHNNDTKTQQQIQKQEEEDDDEEDDGYEEEPLDEKQLSQELTEDKSILRAIFKNPNTYSVIQGAMMLEDEETEGETTKDTTIFNNSEVLNDDI